MCNWRDDALRLVFPHLLGNKLYGLKHCDYGLKITSERTKQQQEFLDVFVYSLSCCLHSVRRVMVKVKNLLNGNVWMWERGKFMNRRYIIQVGEHDTSAQGHFETSGDLGVIFRGATCIFEDPISTLAADVFVRECNLNDFFKVW